MKIAMLISGIVGIALLIIGDIVCRVASKSDCAKTKVFGIRIMIVGCCVLAVELAFLAILVVILPVRDLFLMP